jgi:hypothetical protein
MARFHGMTQLTDTDWRSRALAAEERLEATLAERARLWDEVHRLRAERREVEYYETLAEQMRGSVSWKLTEPLRLAKEIAGKVRRKLAQRER